VEVRIANAEVDLAGTLLQPSCSSPVPAVVLIHGAGPEKRNGAGNMLRDAAVQFASHGIAALIYDKRGNGNSSGDWTKANFTDLADDALAGVGFLQTRADINPGCVGVWDLVKVGISHRWPLRIRREWLLPSSYPGQRSRRNNRN
jgi:uncharacterized protein